MVELGKYAVPVISAFAISLGLLALLVVVSLRQARIAKHNMEAAEARKAARNGS